MGAFGIALILYGILSMILYFLGLNLRALLWMDDWGTGVGRLAHPHWICGSWIYITQIR